MKLPAVHVLALTVAFTQSKGPELWSGVVFIPEPDAWNDFTCQPEQTTVFHNTPPSLNSTAIILVFLLIFNCKE